MRYYARMIVDGKAIAAEILALTKERSGKLSRPPRVVAYAPLITPATASYLKIKKRSAEAAGCMFEETDDLAAIGAADAAIVQLPLPPGMETRATCDRIPLAKDADVLGSEARAKFMRGDVGALLPPVVAAVKEILERAGVLVAGKRAVVVGEGFLVGAPVAAWLAQEGASVTVVRGKTDDLAAALGDAEIIISGAGSPHLITPELIKKGVVLIDAGTSESSGKVAGDADPACAPKCSVFTPVPGGVGPVAVAKLFENAVILAERALQARPQS